jgi:tRNA U55 pseudouridine synthase TruB
MLTARSAVFIKKLKLEKIVQIDNKKLFKNIEKRIKKVQGDFRQDEILKIWRKELLTPNKFIVASFKIKCSSGTYVRSVANSLGEKIGTGALAFSIKRTKIGEYML